MWFRAFGEQDAHGRADVLLIQETHVEASEVGYHERLYAKRWGFKTGVQQPIHSCWSPSPDRKGGVAILAHPYGAFTDMTPFIKDRWSPNFMAVKGKLAGALTIVCYIYAPHRYTPRERFFAELTIAGISKRSPGLRRRGL